jgi:L-alanine-DL-glutamate epimerase-like enolase superfamily enzyme
MGLGAATPNFLISEYPSGFEQSPLGNVLVDRGPKVRDGAITLSDDPGLGVALIQEQVERLTTHSGCRSEMT